MGVDFGEELKRLRIGKNLTQKGLAQSCGIKQPNINRMEKGIIGPSVETLYALCRALDVPCTHFEQFFALDTEAGPSATDPGELTDPPTPAPTSAKGKRGKPKAAE